MQRRENQFHAMVARHKSLMLPFFFLYVCNILALVTLYLSPRKPLAAIFAPPIRKIWGEKFLHYPHNFLLLPKLYNYAHLAISLTIGLLITAIFVNAFQRMYANPQAKLSIKIYIGSLIYAVRRYFALLILFGVIYGISYAILKEIATLTTVHSFSIQITATFFVGVCLQTIFACVIPALIVSNVGIAQAMKNNFLILKKKGLAIFLAVLVPSFLYGIIYSIKYFTPYFLSNFEPEIMLALLSISAFFTTVVDFYITGYCTTIYLSNMK